MNLVQGSIAVLNDATYFLQRLTPSEYTQAIELMSNGTLGQHTRHFIEFYQCLLQQVDAGVVNYCLRKRDLSIEENPKLAVEAIEKILPSLENLNPEMVIDLHSSKEGGTVIKTTVARELYYNIEHCIHHLALIRIGLKIIKPEMSIPKHFGFAPSTLQHRKLMAQ